MKAVYKKELRSYFNGTVAYIVIALLLITVSFCSYRYNVKYGYPGFEQMLLAENIIWWEYPISLLGSLAVKTALFVCPALLAMKAFAEEKHERTDALLYSLPVKMGDVVLGKYLAMMTVFLIPVAIFCFYPFVFSMYGTVNFSAVYSSILAYYLLIGALVAISSFMSTLTRIPAVAMVISIATILAVYGLPKIVAAALPDTEMASFLCISVLIFAVGGLLYLLTKSIYIGIISAFVLEIVNLVLYLFKPELFKGAFSDMVSAVSVFDRFDIFMFGIFDLKVIVYYISIIFVFVFLTIQSLEKKRYC